MPRARPGTVLLPGRGVPVSQVGEGLVVASQVRGPVIAARLPVIAPRAPPARLEALVRRVIAVPAPPTRGRARLALIGAVAVPVPPAHTVVPPARPRQRQAGATIPALCGQEASASPPTRTPVPLVGHRRDPRRSETVVAARRVVAGIGQRLDVTVPLLRGVTAPGLTGKATCKARPTPGRFRARSAAPPPQVATSGRGRPARLGRRCPAQGESSPAGTGE